MKAGDDFGFIAVLQFDFFDLRIALDAPKIVVDSFAHAALFDLADGDDADAHVSVDADASRIHPKGLEVVIAARVLVEDVNDNVAEVH